MTISVLHSLTIIAVFSAVSLTTQYCRAQVTLPSEPTPPVTMKFAMDAPEVAESPSRQLARSQENSYDGVYRCPGPPVVYADSLSEDEARVRNCRRVESPPITVVKAPRPLRLRCRLRAIPAVMCLHQRTAAEIWHQVKFNWSIVNDSNNRQLMAEQQCTTIRIKEYRQISMMEFGRQRIATSHGWTEVVMVDVEGFPMMNIAANYLDDVCISDKEK